MVSYNTVKQNTYYDSVTLMLFSSKLTGAKGVREAAVMMGTDHNKSLMLGSGILTEELAAAITPNDMAIGILAESQADLDAALLLLEEQFENKSKAADGEAKVSVKTLDGAVRQLGSPNFAVISLPGKYAKFEAMKAMKNGMHVLLFSDNVGLDEENELKDYAVSHELLMMGPDCGTAIVNGAALGFANVVARGNIGLVAAAGTGLQEVSVLIDRLGGGVSQALGTGGRDVKDEVGGKMMSLALRALQADPATEVIGIISKPPAPGVMAKIMAQVRGCSKPVVACFLGGDPALVRDAGAVFAATLQEAAAYLVALARNGEPAAPEDEPTAEIVAAECAQYAPAQKYIRGLYSGGSLCYESLLLLEAAAGGVYSNIAHGDCALADVEVSHHHTLVDMGDDYFTDGMPHPMIDPRLRTERIGREAADESVAVILLDCVLGYGSHEDPAGALAGAIAEANAAAAGRHITFIASVCGTDADFQIRAKQEAKLRAAGAIVMPCNAQAAKLAAKIIANIE